MTRQPDSVKVTYQVITELGHHENIVIQLPYITKVCEDFQNRQR